MNRMLHKVNTFLYEDFIFSSRYKVWRHVIYWTFHVTVWATFWLVMGSPASFARNLFNMSLWVPVFILFSYPLVYIAVPNLLLKGKVWQFFLLILAWGAFGLYLIFAFRSYIYIPLQQAIGFEFIPQARLQAHSYLCMTTSAASPMIIRLFKIWTIKQREWLQVQQEKTTAELQLLKAQVHPHFLFNTLNNIYSFSIDKSPKTPDLVLKLSSLLSYMLYDCKTTEVSLWKEIEIMKNYVDLERERYDNKIQISWKIEGEVKDKFITPLLLLPFLENAFKHGLSEQIEKPWLKVDIAVKDNILICNIANSKNESMQACRKGIGLNNVQKRLSLVYHGRYDLKIRDEQDEFLVSLMLELAKPEDASGFIFSPLIASQNIEHETSLPAYR